MALNAAMMASEKQDWCTPANLLERVRLLGPIELDPCGAPGSLVRASREYLLSRGEDGLKLRWGRAPGASGDAPTSGLVFVNPPYGDATSAWVDKAITESERGVEIVMLVAARPDNRWFQRLLREASAICFIAGRLVFVGAEASAPFPSAVIYFGDREEVFAGAFHTLGAVVS